MAAGGADFVFLGGPGVEMASPRFYRDLIVPYSREVTQMVHANGLMVYTHICSPIEPLLTMGFYNQMGLDLFETLSGPPVGNIKGIEGRAWQARPRDLHAGQPGPGPVDEPARPARCRAESLHILSAARRLGRKHILAASDYLFYNTREENVPRHVRRGARIQRPHMTRPLKTCGREARR